MSSIVIYGILDPRNNECRYVGKTNSICKRIISHRYAATSNVPGHKYNWFRSVLREGLLPEFIILEEVTVDNWKTAEAFWICYLMGLGANLLNMTKGGEGTVGFKHSDFSKSLMREDKLGTIMSPESSMKKSVAMIGNTHTLGFRHSLETRAKMSAARKGVSNGKNILTVANVKDILTLYYSSTLFVKDIYPELAPFGCIRGVVGGKNWKELDWYREELIEQYGDRRKNVNKQQPSGDELHLLHNAGEEPRTTSVN